MNYIKVSKAAEKWGISARRVRLLCANGKIDGVIRKGNLYMIPENAMKPLDGRTNKKNILLDIQRKRERFVSLRPLTQGEVERLAEEFMIDFTYNSNAIEGNTLTLKETALALEGMTIDQKPLKDHLEAVGHRDAFLYVQDVAKQELPLSETVIKNIHALVLMNRPDDKGVYRRIPIRVMGAYTEPVQPYMIEPIVNFHNTEDRFAKFIAALEADKMGRAKDVQAEVQFVLDRKADCSVALQAMRDGKLPLRVTHNDTKLNNVLIDEASLEGICIIDLDTTMPGLSIYDFGDSVRFGANHSAEDEKDLTKVNFDIELYECYTRGFLQGAGGCLTEAELEYLSWGARLMTLECGIRFLTDYLDGDNYFHIHYHEQNLDRCRTQFKLVKDMEEQFMEMHTVVSRCSAIHK